MQDEIQVVKGSDLRREVEPLKLIARKPVQVRIAKRLFDVVFTVLMFPIVLPLFLIIPFLIRLDSRGSIFFRQPRVGLGGVPFFLHKFRTMTDGADSRLSELLENDHAARKEFTANYKLRDDPRVTRVGRLLRRTSLDELPQIWNVLRGDMSWVGPRPIVEEEKVLYGEAAEQLVQALPGITGLWQVCGRSDTSYEERVRLDLKYIETASLWTDVKLVLRTIPAVISCKGAL